MVREADPKARRHVSPFAIEDFQEATEADHGKEKVTRFDVPVDPPSKSDKSMATATVRPTRDILWQENPDRILKYRANNLHYYGWIPFLNLRNLKGTIFSDVYLHLQTGLLLSWVLVLHLTGVGVDDDDFRSFIKLFGTPYAGSIFNVGMVMVFILGLFISLVINRWSAIRQAYGQLRGTTQDLCMIIAHAIHDPNNMKDKRTQKARTELVRLLNLGHLLVVTRADGQNQEFMKSAGLKTFGKHAWKRSRRFLGMMGFDTVVEEVEDQWEKLWKKKARDVTYKDLLAEGLINPDEWKLLQEGEKQGLPGYQTVYYWVQTLVHKCRAAEWIISGSQMLPVILNKINMIVSAGSTILNTINSQMPYPYVHLVSFTAHSYLIIASTWFGCFLRVGYPGEKFQGSGLEGANLNFKDLIREPTPIKHSGWTVAFCYLLVAAASIMFQGLLNMHSLLDNPFGRHCAKFPLRAQIAQVMNSTRAMLTHGLKCPRAFGDVFSLDAVGSLDTEYTITKTASKASSFADFLHPPTRVEGSHATGLSSKRLGSRDIPSPRTVKTLSGIRECEPKPSRLRQEAGVPGSPMEELTPRIEEATPRPVADEGMVRSTEPEAAPKTTKCLRRGVSPHNEVLFGNLPENTSSQTSHSYGDPALQELYLQVSVADAVQHSFSSLRNSIEQTTMVDQTQRQTLEDNISEDPRSDKVEPAQPAMSAQHESE